MNGVKEVKQEHFLHELNKELNYMENGGTSYRIKTVKLALDIANKTTVESFSSRKSAMEVIANLKSEVDLFRMQDVSKLLHTVWSDLNSKANLSDDIKQQLESRRKNREYKLVRVKQES